MEGRVGRLLRSVLRLGGSDRPRAAPPPPAAPPAIRSGLAGISGDTFVRGGSPAGGKTEPAPLAGAGRDDPGAGSFDPRRRYTGVVFQPGQVQVDSDWNETDGTDEPRLRAPRESAGGAARHVDGGGLGSPENPDRDEVDP